MAKKLVYLDDMDGTPIEEGTAGGPIEFSLGETFYRIDLNEKNTAKLQKALAPFIEKAEEVEPPKPEPVTIITPRTTRRSSSGDGGGGSGRTKEELDTIRTWARQNGHEVADRGRIKGEIIAAFDAAQGK